jgi:hypothetical protein
VLYAAQINKSRGEPQTICVANGPEYISEQLVMGVEKRGVRIQHIFPYNRTRTHTRFAVQPHERQQNA